LNGRRWLGLALSAFLCVAARANDLSSGTVRLAIIEPASTSAGSSLDVPLERLLRLSSSTVRLLDIQSVPCYHSGTDYRLRLPPAGAPASSAFSSTMSAVALEAETEAALIFPPVPSLVEGLRAMAEDPATYHTPWLIHATTKTLSLSQVLSPTGEALVTAQLDPAAGEGARWLPALAESYRLKWQGQEVSVVIIAKLHGGLGRLATLLAREKKKGEILGVARSDAFGTGLTGLGGRGLADKLESLGLQYSAIGSAEVRRFSEVQKYRKEKPNGIQFLSANLVYTSSPTLTLVPDHAVVETDGLKLCLVGMTPPEAAKYLHQGGIPIATVADPVAAFQAKSTIYRRECDLVVILGALTPESARLRYEALGADVIVADLGVSSMQLDNPARGFTYKDSGPLDMRMNPARGEPASQLLTHLSETRLARLLEEHADEPDARPIARALKGQAIATTGELARRVRSAVTAEREAGANRQAVSERTRCQLDARRAVRRREIAARRRSCARSAARYRNRPARR